MALQAFVAEESCVSSLHIFEQISVALAQGLRFHQSLDNLGLNRRVVYHV